MSVCLIVPFHMSIHLQMKLSTIISVMAVCLKMQADGSDFDGNLLNTSQIDFTRRLNNETSNCDRSVIENHLFRRYFHGMDSIYSNDKGRNFNVLDSTCIPIHKKCGWPKIQESNRNNLPLYILSVGLEG